MADHSETKATCQVSIADMLQSKNVAAQSRRICDMNRSIDKSGSSDSESAVPVNSVPGNKVQPMILSFLREIQRLNSTAVSKPDVLIIIAVGLIAE